jgi:hypothetical protein
MRYLGYRVLTQLQKGTELGPAASVAKLYWSEYHVAATELARDPQRSRRLLRAPLTSSSAVPANESRMSRQPQPAQLVFRPHHRGHLLPPGGT